MNKGIKSLDRRSQRAFMQSKWRVIVPVFGDAPHPAGNRATRRAALKAQRTKARQRSRKNQSRIAIVLRAGSVTQIRRVIRSFEEVSAAARVFGRSLDGVQSVSFSPDAGSR